MTPLRPSRILRSDFTRYVLVSMAALALDLAVLSACLRLGGLDLPLSASIGFSAGAVLAYVLSTRWVFRHRAYRDAPRLEFAMFVAIGLAGLGVTQLVLWVGAGRMGLLPEAVKFAAAAVTFLFNYAVRKTLLFVARPRAGAVRGTPA